MAADLRLLRYFVTVAEELNFTRAAARLHMAQQPLSAAIRRFEADLGVALFRRTTRRVELTDAGRTLLEPARSALHAGDDALAAARATGHESPATSTSGSPEARATDSSPCSPPLPNATPPCTCTRARTPPHR